MKKQIKAFIIISLLAVLFTLVLSSCTGFFSCAHNWDSGEILIDPTEEKSGLVVYVCTLCEETKLEKIDHLCKWGEGTINTDEETGISYKTFECLICGKEKTVEFDINHEHEWDEGKVTKEPSCVFGTMTYTCLINGCFEEMTEEIPVAFEHEWADPTCDEPKTCQGCGLTDGLPLGHSWDEGQVTLEPTCKKGITLFTCLKDGCQATFAEEIEAIYEHTWQDADCDTPKTCTACGEEEGSPLGHSWDGGVNIATATCIEEGIKLYTCLVCSDQKEEITPTTTWGHLWDEGEITIPPTCANDGVKTFLCTREGCDGIKTETVATEWWNHTWQDATCEAPKSCKYCDLTEGESLGGHIWDDGQVTTEPSCEVGEITYTCQRENCQTIKTEEIEPIYDHVFETTENEIEIDGKFFYEEACECGQTRPGEEIEKTEEPEAPSNETEE